MRSIFNDSLSFETMMQSRKRCINTSSSTNDQNIRHDFYLGVSPDTTQELVTDWRCSYRDEDTKRYLTKRSEIVWL